MRITSDAYNRGGLSPVVVVQVDSDWTRNLFRYAHKRKKMIKNEEIFGSSIEIA